MNGISVANFNDASNTTPSAWSISSSSSHGPTIDGRKKPDIAAPGSSIQSCAVGGGFTFKSGTSMAAPHIAGAAALMWQYLSINNASVGTQWFALIAKGILLHTAYDLGTTGYDYTSGYGAVDMGSVWNFLQTGSFMVETISRPYTLAKYQLNLSTPQEINITVLWNRYASTDYELTDYSSLSDINIRLEAENGTTLASSLSSIDNVEQLSYSATNGTYFLMAEVTQLNHDPQDFAIITSHPLSLVEKIRKFPWDSDPPDATYMQGTSGSITWTLYDNFDDGGIYRVLQNDSQIIGWTIWANNTPFNVNINATTPGVWNYTIQYRNSAGLWGTSGIVLITISPLESVGVIPGFAFYLGIVIFSALTVVYYQKKRRSSKHDHQTPIPIDSESSVI